MNLRVSIIIAVYNMEDKLAKCLSSVKNQTYNNFEVILINDGSTDNSEEVCNNHIKDDLRFKYYKHKNIGVGRTRDKAIRLAQGEFIFFLDADDTIEPETIETLCNAQQLQNADIVNYSYKYIKNGIIEIHESAFPKYQKIGQNEFRKLLKRDFLNKKKLLWFSTINFIRRSLIIDNGIRHSPKLLVGVDSTFNLQCFLNARTIYSIKDPLYNYYFNEVSLTQKSYRKNFLENIEIQCFTKKKILDQYDSNSKLYYTDLARYYIQHSLFYLFRNESSSPEGITKNWLKTVRYSKLYQFCISNYKYSEYLPFKQRLMVFLFKKKLFTPLLMILNIRNK